MGYEFELPYSGGQYGNDNDNLVVQKFCKNVTGDYRKTIVYNTVSGALGNFPVGVFQVEGTQDDLCYEEINGVEYRWPNDNVVVPTGEWIIDSGTHHFRVRDSQGNLKNSWTVEIWEGNHQVFDPDSAVLAPTNLHTTSTTSSEITLAWDDNENPDGTDYKIYRDGQLINNGVPDKQYTDVNLSPSTTYAYEVSAVYNGEESAKSSTLNVSTNSTNYYIQITSPNGGETFNRGDTVTVTYNYNIPGTQVYFYYTFTGDPNDWFSRGAIEATGTYNWVADDTPSDVYLIKIFALNDNSVSDITDDYFSVVSPEPSPPTNVGYTNLTATSAKITWQDTQNDSGTVDSYNVYRFDGNSTVVAGSTTNLYLDDTGLQPETGYHHWVKAVRNGYESDGSNEINFVTPAEPVDPTLSVSPDALDFDSTQTQLSFDISSNTDWTLVLSDNWLSVNTQSGNGNATINTTVDRSSLTAGSYNGTVIVNAGTLSDTVSISMLKNVDSDSSNSDSSSSSVDSSEQVTFTDDFDRSSLGSSWLVDNSGGNGDAFIEDNKLKLNGPYNGNVKATAVADDSLILKDVTVNFYMDNGPSTRANNSTQVYVYYLDDNNFYRVAINEDDYDSGYRRRVYIDKLVDGVRTELAASDRYFMLNPGTYQFRVVNDSLSFKNISGGTSINLTAVDNSLTQPGKIIFRAGEEVVYIDNVEISGMKVVDPSQNTQSKPGNQFELVVVPKVPTEFSLSQNYPNPFNPETRIDYALPQDCYTTIVIYNMLGQQMATVVNKFHSAGFYSVTWRPNNLSSGIYFYHIKAGKYEQIKKLILIR